MVNSACSLAAIILSLPHLSSDKAFVSQAQFERWYDSATTAAGWFHLGIDFKGSVGAFAENIARVQLAANPQFQALPSAEIGRASCRERVCQYV